MQATDNSAPAKKRVRHVHKTALGRELWFRLRNYGVCHPSLYFAYYRLRNKNQHIAVNEATDLVLEGYGGSANTFTVRAIQACNNDALNIAHHMHAPAQILRGLELGIPVIVLLRDPVDAAVSCITRQTVKYDPKDLPQILSHRIRGYSVFYECVFPFKDQYVVAPFTQITENFGEIIRAANAKFGTDFVPPDYADKSIGRDMSKYKPVTRVNEKEDLLEVANSAALTREREEARGWFEAMLA